MQIKFLLGISAPRRVWGPKTKQWLHIVKTNPTKTVSNNEEAPAGLGDYQTCLRFKKN